MDSLLIKHQKSEEKLLLNALDLSDERAALVAAETAPSGRWNAIIRTRIGRSLRVI